MSAKLMGNEDFTSSFIICPIVRIPTTVSVRSICSRAMSSSYTDYLDEVRHQQQFNYGAIAIYTITLIASFVMCIIALVKLRVFKDLARKFIRWNLAAFVFYTM